MQYEILSLDLFTGSYCLLMNPIVFFFFAFILEIICECLKKKVKIFVAAQICPRLLYFVDFTVKLHYPLKPKVMMKS